MEFMPAKPISKRIISGVYYIIDRPPPVSNPIHPAMRNHKISEEEGEAGRQVRPQNRCHGYYLQTQSEAPAVVHGDSQEDSCWDVGQHEVDVGPVC